MTLNAILDDLKKYDDTYQNIFDVLQDYEIALTVTVTFIVISVFVILFVIGFRLLRRWRKKAQQSKERYGYDTEEGYIRSEDPTDKEINSSFSVLTTHSLSS